MVDKVHSPRIQGLAKRVLGPPLGVQLPVSLAVVTRLPKLERTPKTDGGVYLLKSHAPLPPETANTVPRESCGVLTVTLDTLRKTSRGRGMRKLVQDSVPYRDLAEEKRGEKEKRKV